MNLKQLLGIIGTLVCSVGATGGATWYTKAEVDKTAIIEEVRAQLEPVVEKQVLRTLKDQEADIVKASVERVHLENSADKVRMQNDIENIRRDVGSLQDGQKRIEDLALRSLEALGTRTPPPRRPYRPRSPEPE